MPASKEEKRPIYEMQPPSPERSSNRGTNSLPPGTASTPPPPCSSSRLEVALMVSRLIKPSMNSYWLIPTWKYPNGAISTVSYSMNILLFGGRQLTNIIMCNIILTMMFLNTIHSQTKGCNEAYSEGWDDKFKGYLKRLKTGKGQTGQRYTQRYVGSMVGDVSIITLWLKLRLLFSHTHHLLPLHKYQVHRTLMYGGIFCCPSDTEVHHKGNLQLVYKSAPMAYILEHAGGKATDGNVNLLSVQPNYVHERSPCFMGSPEDMDELTSHLGTGSQWWVVNCEC